MDKGNSLLFDQNDNNVQNEFDFIKSIHQWTVFCLEQASKIASEVIIVRNSGSLKLSAFILLCLCLGVNNFPKTTMLMVALFGWYAWNVYKIWCSDFKDRSPREERNSPSNKDVPLLVTRKRRMKRQHSLFWRQKRDEGMAKGQRILKVSHSVCQCIGNVANPTSALTLKMFIN